jgi:hypothetical protein
VRCFIISPNGVQYELAIRLEFRSTNNQGVVVNWLREFG